MKLELKLFGKVLKEISLEPEREYFLGRSPSCDIVLEEDLDLSRRHLRIYQTEGSKNWNIESLTEKSGLYFNGEELTEFEIQNNCFFNLKNYVLSFATEEAEPFEDEKNADKNVVTGRPAKEEPVADSSSFESLNGEDMGTQIIPSARLLHCLRISIEGEFSDYINLNVGKKWIIGRSEDCDVSINYDLLTRQHLEIEKKEDRFYVKDLGSTNKTHLNGRVLSPHKSMPLNVDDEISVNDLKIVFEIRDTDYENKIRNLPAPPAKNEEEDPFSGAVAPKLVLENFVEEESEKKAFQPDFRKKLVFALTLLILVCLGVWLFNEDIKNKQRTQAESQKIGTNQDLEHRLIYEEAQNNYRSNNFDDCLASIEELHRKVALGFYEDSKQLQNECQTGLEIMDQKRAEEKAEKKRLETEAKIKALVGECEDQYNKGFIKTLSDINECAKKLFDLDPNNAKISQIKISLKELEVQNQLVKKKKEKHKSFLQSKKRLYEKAKKIDKEKQPLKAVSAFDRFLKAARGTAALKSLYIKAEAEREAIQNKYEAELKSLRSSCAALVENEKLKEAYPSCRKVLQFKNHDPAALAHIEEIKRALSFELKPIYEEAQWHESFSRVDEALKKWEEILERDIKGGHYYKKALAQIKKYE